MKGIIKLDDCYLVVDPVGSLQYLILVRSQDPGTRTVKGWLWGPEGACGGNVVECPMDSLRPIPPELQVRGCSGPF